MPNLEADIVKHLSGQEKIDEATKLLESLIDTKINNEFNRITAQHRNGEIKTDTFYEDLRNLIAKRDRWHSTLTEIYLA